MNCLIDYNQNSKKIRVSANTDCFWSCIVTEGNITLNQNHGILNSSNSHVNSGITIYTYNTSDMYGTIACRFQDDGGCVVKRYLTIESTPLHVFYVPQTNNILFGEGTKSYIYVYYGTLNKVEEDVLDTLLIQINYGDDITNTVIEYKGSYTNIVISANSLPLYQIELQNYNDDLKYFEIVITSLTNYIFHDVITIHGKNSNGESQQFTVNLTQTIVENAPTLLKISPTFVFLDTDNPKQKITVTSIYNGIPRGYRITASTAVTTSELIRTNDIEEYLHSSDIMPLRVDNLEIPPLVTEKNATHFILDMSSVGENADNVGNAEASANTAYELYVVQEGNPSNFQKLEFFYDYKYNPNNDIRITKIEGIYGYGDSNGVFSATTTLENTDIPVPVTLYFTKNDTTPSSVNSGYVYAKYSEKENVKFTIKSVPKKWKINALSDYVREVKQGDELHISLETTIPDSATTFVSLVNENGRVCTVYCKSDNDIFSNLENMFYFIVDGNIQTSASATINGDEFIKIGDIKSTTNEEKWYYFTHEFSASSADTTITLQTIKYAKNLSSVVINETIVSYNFPILYNGDIKKYYINYGSITQKYNNEIEVKDTNKYYFVEKNKKLYVEIPIPEKSRFVPWTVTNNGCGVKYNIYTLTSQTATAYTQLNTSDFLYKPLSDTVEIFTIKKLPSTIDRDKTNAIILVPFDIFDNFSTTSAIIFQQMDSLQEVTCFITLSLNEGEKQIVNKYGTVSAINSMKTFSSSTESNAFFNSELVEIDVTNNNVGKLFYASYEKEDAFTVNEQNVSLYIVEEGDTERKTQWIGSNINYENATLSSFSSNTFVTVDNALWDTMSSSHDNKLINCWKIEDGFLYVYENKDEYEANNPSQSYFPQNNVFNKQINGEDVGFLFVENYTYDNNDNPKPLSGSIFNYFCVLYKETNYLKLNGNVFEINQNSSSITYNCLYKILDKTVNFGDGNIHIFDNQNTLQYIDGKYVNKCVAYQDNDKWYVNLPSATFPIQWNNGNGKKYFYINYNTTKLSNDMRLTLNGTTYNPVIKVNLKGLQIDVLTNIDGENEKFIIINNVKYVANNGVISLKFDYNLSIRYDSQNHPYVLFDKDFFIDIIYEPFSYYVTINDEEYTLTDDGYLIYESEKYEKIPQGDDYFIVINNKGYKVYEKNAVYYIILNYIKYNYTTSGTTLSVKSYENKYNQEYFVEEIANDTFSFNLNFDDLLSNDIITSEYNGLVITDSYAKIPNNTFFAYGNYPTKKEIWLDKTIYPYNVRTDEIIQPSSSLTLSISSITFYDDTQLIFENGDEMDIKIENEIPYSYPITSNTLFTINDYSKISFNGTCFLTVKNDCEIELVISENNSTVLFLKRNETLFIDNNTTLIFKNVTKIKINKDNDLNLYTFTDVVFYENNLYIASTIDDKKVVTINNEIYYVYDGRININGVYLKCYEKSIGYKIISGNVITSQAYEVNKVFDDKNEPKYFYFGNAITKTGECFNANKDGGAGITDLYRNILNGDSITITCDNKNHEGYASPSSGSSVYLWFKEDNLLDNQRKTYMLVSNNFGVNEPINNFTIPNDEFILITPTGSTSGRRYYVTDNKISYDGALYSVSGDAGNRYVKIGQNVYKTATSNAPCCGIKIFLNNNANLLIAFSYTVTGKTIVDFNDTNILYYATIPYFIPTLNKWDVETKRLTNISVFDKNNFIYTKAILSGHSNVGNVIIENNILKYNVDCYRVKSYDTTYNGNREGGCGYTNFSQEYNIGETIQFEMLDMNGDENYSSLPNGATLLLWFKGDKNLPKSGTSYEFTSINFGIKQPLVDYIIPNGEFIFIPSKDSDSGEETNNGERCYVRDNKVVYNRQTYNVSGESDNRYVKIGDTEYDLFTSSATCFAYKIFLYGEEYSQDKKIRVTYNRYKYSSKKDDYKIGNYSIWDYSINDYAKHIITYSASTLGLTVNKTITLNDIKYSVDQNKYVYIDNVPYPIYSLVETDVLNLSFTNNIATKNLKFLKENGELSNQTITFTKINKEGVIIYGEKYYVEIIDSKRCIKYKTETFEVENDSIEFTSFYFDDKIELIKKSDKPEKYQDGYFLWNDTVEIPLQNGGHVFVVYAIINNQKYYVTEWNLKSEEKQPCIEIDGIEYELIPGNPNNQDNVYDKPYIKRTYVRKNILTKKYYINNDKISYHDTTLNVETKNFIELSMSGQEINGNSVSKTFVLFDGSVEISGKGKFEIRNSKIYSSNNQKVGVVNEYGYAVSFLLGDKYFVKIQFDGETEIPNFYQISGDIESVKEEQISLKVDAYGASTTVAKVKNFDEYTYTMNPKYQIKVSGNSLNNETVELADTTIYSLSAITSYDDNSTNHYGIVYNDALYMINNKLLTIPKNCEIRKAVINGKMRYLILFDINANLTFNFNFNFSNEKQGNVHNFTVQNALDVSHTEHIMIKSNNHISDNNLFNPTIGYYKANSKKYLGEVYTLEEWQHCFIDVQPYESYQINVYGGDNVRGYVFLDKNNYIIDFCDVKYINIDKVITIPYNCVKLLVHNKKTENDSPSIIKKNNYGIYKLNFNINQ